MNRVKLFNNKQQGFTLIEVVFAVVILSSSLVVLIGLQSAAISKSLRDRNQLQAMMAARSILAAIEIDPEGSEFAGPVSREDTVYDLLEDFNLIPETDTGIFDQYSNFRAVLEIEEWDNPEELAALAEQNLLRRVFLQIYWGDAPEDKLEVVYFIPNVQNNSQQS